jgi:hypothetical protein
MIWSFGSILPGSNHCSIAGMAENVVPMLCQCFTNVLPIYPLNSSFTTPEHFKGELDAGTKKPRKHWV